MKLPPALDNLSKIRYAKVIGIILALLVNIGFVVLTLYISSQVAYYILMIGTVVFTFLIPYIFGLREAKTLVVAGIALFFITGAINGPMVANKMYHDARAEHLTPPVTISEPDPVTGDYLYDPSITPLEGASGQTYTFSVWYHSNQTPPTARVQVVYQQHLFYELVAKNMSAVDETDTNFADGKEYFYTSTATEFNNGIYLHYYELNYSSRTTYLPEDQLFYGPINGESSSIFTFYAGIGAMSMFCNVGLMFIIVVMLYWWLSTAKQRREKWMDAAREGREEADRKAAELSKEVETEVEEGEEFTCTSCGANVNISANFCPNCGEMFEGVEEEEGSEKEMKVEPKKAETTGQKTDSDESPKEKETEQA